MTPLRDSESPLRPLTSGELRVAELVGEGMAYKAIGAALGMEPETARRHVLNIAAKLPNPDGLKPYTLVLLEFAHRKWLKAHEESPGEAA